MKCLIALLGLVALASAIANYDGYQVLRVVPQTAREVYLIRQVVDSDSGLDFWTEPRALGVSVDVLVQPKTNMVFKNFLNRKNIVFTVMIDDVQSLINNEAISLTSKAGQPRKFDHTTYHDLAALYVIIDATEVDFPSLVTTKVLGTTFEGRPIRQVQVSAGGGGSRPVIWIDCGIHAREWISPATCQYFLDQLTSGYGSDPTVTALLDAQDFYILPSVNPDGYAFSWSNDRLWRKNRVPSGGLLNCFGVDGNRNFDAGWGTVGTSDQPCSEVYHGPSAFSEAETQAVRDGVLAVKDRLKAFFSIHSYSQLWMTPFGYTNALPANYNEQDRVAGIGVSALQAVYGTAYTHGNVYVVIYPSSGDSADWAHETAGAPYSYIVELRDTGTYGFVLPADQIIPVGEETWAGFVAAIQAMP